MIPTMAQALNYAAQAHRGLIAWANSCPASVESDKNAVLRFAEAISQAVHFSIPDGGVLFDDGLKGIIGEIVRLPYQQITIEYHVPLGELTEKAPYHSPKRLVFATELSRDQAKSLLANEGDKFRDLVISDVVIFVFVASEVRGKWHPMPLGWLVNTSAWEANGVVNIDLRERGYKSRVAGIPYPTCPVIASKLVNDLGKQAALESMMHDISAEVVALFEFLEAMACSNVRATPIQKANSSVNARRVKQGKLPIWEIKTLTIDVPGRNGSARTGIPLESEGRNSPREHLRRGHVRIMGEKRIWVQSCVVSAGNTGAVAKTYRVRKSA